jgi:hypothetical protein
MFVGIGCPSDLPVDSQLNLTVNRTLSNDRIARSSLCFSRREGTLRNVKEELKLPPSHPHQQQLPLTANSTFFVNEKIRACRLCLLCGKTATSLIAHCTVYPGISTLIT